MSDLAWLRSELEEWKKRSRASIRTTPCEREQSFQSGVLSTCDSVLELLDDHEAVSHGEDSGTVAGDD